VPLENGAEVVHAIVQVLLDGLQHGKAPGAMKVNVIQEPTMQGASAMPDTWIWEMVLGALANDETPNAQLLELSLSLVQTLELLRTTAAGIFPRWEKHVMPLAALMVWILHGGWLRHLHRWCPTWCKNRLQYGRSPHGPGLNVMSKMRLGSMQHLGSHMLGSLVIVAQ
jgi:hypothetical protein